MWMLPRVLVTTLQGRPHHNHHRFVTSASPYQFSTFCFTLAAILSSRPVHTFADPIRPNPRRRGARQELPVLRLSLVPDGCALLFRTHQKCTGKIKRFKKESNQR